MTDGREQTALEIAALINLHITGKIGPADQLKLDEWLNQSTKNRELFGQLSTDLYREQLISGMQQYDREAALERLNKRIAVSVVPLQRKRSIKKALLIAAVIAGIIFLPLAYQYRAVINSWFHPLTYKIAMARQGERKILELSDGTKVWLNSGTTLKYPASFDGDTRKITLKSGEAFFEVAHDAHKAFIVNANGADVQVLGTSFEVSAFDQDQEMKVTVSTGKVGVMPAAVHQPATFLLPGDRAIIDRIHHTLHLVHVDTADIAAWRSNRLVFADQPLPEVFASLERKYNVHIQIESNRLFTEKVTMRLNNQPIDNVLTALSFANHFKYQKINAQLIVVK